MQILDGKATASHYKEEIKKEAEELLKERGKTPHLAAVLVGNDPASHTYVNHKIKACKEVGFKSSLLQFEDTITEEELLEEIDKLNKDDEIDGFIVQVPLPAHINKSKILLAVDYRKDVDGFHPYNIGRMTKNLPALLPATPMGILQLIRHYRLKTIKQHCVVVGRSEIVGSPVSILMSRPGYPGDCTVTITHVYTEDLASHTRQADILITAVGKPGLITGDMVKEGAVVIDVGITRVEDPSKKKGFALKGDVDYENVAPKCSFITPVPGGVGPMTITALLQNTLLAARKEIYS